jgi:hypothetical protein
VPEIPLADGMANLQERIRLMAESLVNETWSRRPKQQRLKRLPSPLSHDERVPIELCIPKLRMWPYRLGDLPAERLRMGRVAIPAVPEMVTNGVSTRKVEKVAHYAHVLRVVQKIAYLYSWPGLFDENGEIDEGTKSMLTLFLGIMSGAEMAGQGVNNLAKGLAAGVAKKLPQKALTKGTVYPIVKKVAGYLGVQMSKQTFSKEVSEAVPIIGGAVSGSLTFATFRPMSAKLRDYLAGLPLADPARQAADSAGDSPEADTVVEVAADVVDVDPVVPADAPKDGSQPAATD